MPTDDAVERERQGAGTPGTDVTKDGLRGVRPDREAVTGVTTGRPRGGRGRRRRGGETPQVPDATFTSYYAEPVINKPVWEAPDIPGYLFLGGLAGAASLLGAGAQRTGRRRLERSSKVGAVAAGFLSLVGLVHDLGRPQRFLNMLRVFKVTSPMSVGSWLLAGYIPVAGAAAASAVTGRAPRAGAAATVAAATLGPAVASYTAALISDTAVPAWHDGYREMPFVFVGSGATAAGGLGLLTAPVAETGPARALALAGTALELATFERMERRLGMVGEVYSQGRGGAYVRAGTLLSVAGVVGAVLGRRSRVASAVCGAAMLAASAATRWGVFHAGMQSADDPKYTVVPQRQRLEQGEPATGTSTTTRTPAATTAPSEAAEA
ncbi:MAG: polysulfide reductase NrfD [Pseudonocardia sp.]|uniref:NrfD/PsrC family molybdoenzyme membrane anchor subunit n=1 Tax=unclassified Pseudonocardia TaxID=2619320 RepID=UPI00086A1A48|nr:MULTISPECIES: NrfD/PsrC family molybdoenzyme membrane anchor subunit [unclassified Pseudonocardia]MBN9110836.1 polysulfide reductase NrfD [Pseudonocardia sp.]ODU26861.1 MAG: polysulfide reductase [Pseudonocardia sp. SCN 72-51]ODV05418.1 MAG: polysulfide reductase [Pseudonocardia sp. SCN 73-27]